MWMTSCTGSACGGFWGFWKKSVSWILGPDENGWLSLARRVGCARGLGQMEKSGVSLSLCRKTFKLKGNKKFRTWTKKSSSVFRVSGFLCSMYICNEHSMFISHIRIMGMLYIYIIYMKILWKVQSLNTVYKNVHNKKNFFSKWLKYSKILKKGNLYFGYLSSENFVSDNQVYTSGSKHRIVVIKNVRRRGRKQIEKETNVCIYMCVCVWK